VPSTKALLRFAFLCVALGRLGLAAASLPALPPTATCVLSYALLNLGQGTTTTLLKATMAQVTGGSRLGLMLGVLASVEKGVGIAAPLIGGPVYDRVAPWAPACFASASAFIGLFVAAWLRLTPSAPACAPAATRAVQRRAVSPPRRRTPSPKRKRA